MRHILLFLALFQAGQAFAQVPMTAQPGQQPPAGAAEVTARGVEALMQGDYTKAAALLTPLMSQWAATINDAAAFFLAALYENGLGVPQDLPRACALYLRVQADGGPFARLAAPLAREHMGQLGPEQTSECVMLASAGISHGFSPATFTLEDERVVAINVSTASHEVVATVSHQGKEKTSSLQAALASGSIFLPIEHTALEWPRASGQLRHFIEVAAWVPLEDGRWQLAWSLSEIAGTDVLPVSATALSSIAGPMPPSDVTVSLRELVSLEVNAAGDVEFAILNGADAARQRVPDVAERRDALEEARKRRAADDKVNWKRKRDPERAPSFAYTDARACGLMSIYGWSAERAESIAIRADRAFIEAQAAEQGAFDLAALPPQIDVVVNVFDRSQRDWTNCSDAAAIEEGQRQETWRAAGGTIRFVLPETGASGADASRAAIQIENAEFVSPSGASSRPARPITVSAVAAADPAQ
jgi:hypothetical protein